MAAVAASSESGGRSGGRYYSLKSPLRPTYADYLPTFNDDELLARAAALAPHLATQLNPENILTYNRLFGCDWWRNYQRRSNAERRHLLLDVLESVGLRATTLRAFDCVPRHAFVSARYTDYAYLNWSVPLSDQSCLSVPLLVGLMIQEIDDATEGEVLEIGGGVGFHACLLAQKCPSLRVTAYEAYRELAEQGNGLCQDLGSQRVRLVGEAFTSQVLPRPLAAAYHTTAHPPGAVPAIATALREQGVYTFLRPLSEDEFHREPRDIWLHSLFPTFEDYRANGWARICALESTRSVDGLLEHASTLYGVTFVPWQHETFDTVRATDDSTMDRLIKELNQ